MSKGTLTFNLSDPDDMVNFKQAVHASQMAGVLFEFRHNFMRNLERELNKEGADPYDEVLKLLNETLEPIDELGITLIQ